MMETLALLAKADMLLATPTIELATIIAAKSPPSSSTSRS